MAVGILSADDLQAVTGYVKPSAQARALTRMGIAFKVRPDGKPVVLWSALDVKKSDVSAEPNFRVLSR